MFQLSGVTLFYELSSLAALLALSMRSQISLRAILLFAYAFHVVDDYVSPHGPVWEHVIWNLVFFVFNLYMLSTLVYGRTTFWFTAEQRELFSLFVLLTPGEFRKLSALAAWHTAENETPITMAGAVPDKLYFVYEGRITITKGERTIAVDPLTFIGEVAFLRGSAASASVTLSPGARWVEWSVPKLRALLSRDIPLRMSFTRLLSEDLALKVARA